MATEDFETHPRGTQKAWDKLLDEKDLEIERMRFAMQEFVGRCEAGEILSNYTYAQFKKILDEVS